MKKKHTYLDHLMEESELSYKNVLIALEMLHKKELESIELLQSNGYKVIHPKYKSNKVTKEAFKKYWEEQDKYYKKLINKINNK